MAAESRRLVSISTRRRFRRVGAVDNDIASVWPIIVGLALANGASRYMLEDPSGRHGTEGDAAGRHEEIVQLGLEARALNLFSDDEWMCGISDEGTAISALLPRELVDSVRDTVEATALIWDEF